MVKISETNFWDFVRVGNPDQCWPWLGRGLAGGRHGHRYGTFSMGMGTIYAHRFAYTLRNGPIPLGQHLMHACDNTLCCNPAHLKPGSRSENMQDMKAKGRGRWARGANHGLAKLDPERAMAIFNDPRTYMEIAAAYGVGYTCVGNIKRGETWSHVTGKIKAA
jgi:hypothetical protein